MDINKIVARKLREMDMFSPSTVKTGNEFLDMLLKLLLGSISSLVYDQLSSLDFLYWYYKAQRDGSNMNELILKEVDKMNFLPTGSNMVMIALSEFCKSYVRKKISAVNFREMIDELLLAEMRNRERRYGDVRDPAELSYDEIDDIERMLNARKGDTRKKS